MARNLDVSLTNEAPTEPGWYFVNLLPPMYSDSWVFVEVLIGADGQAVICYPNGARLHVRGRDALWSKRVVVFIQTPPPTSPERVDTASE